MSWQLISRDRGRFRSTARAGVGAGVTGDGPLGWADLMLSGSLFYSYSGGLRTGGWHKVRTGTIALVKLKQQRSNS